MVKTDMQRGAAAVEFALVLPLLLLLVLGGIDWGHYFFVAQVVTNATREGARAGSLEPDDDLGATTIAEQTAADYLTRGALEATRATVDTALVGNAIVVTITYPVGSITGFSEVAIPARAWARVQMRRF